MSGIVNRRELQMSVLQELEKMAEKVEEPGVRHSILMSAHILRYPLADILSKVPGDTLKERAERCGVSRQTMYVWGHEKFRPSTDQAKIISDLTGVPVWQICDLQRGHYGIDVGTADAKAGGGLAEDGAGVPSVKRRTADPDKPRARAKSRMGGSPRKVRRRTG